MGFADPCHFTGSEAPKMGPCFLVKLSPRVGDSGCSLPIAGPVEIVDLPIDSMVDLP